jgi:ATP-dependent Clp protease ATP-binding subunit ClpC
MLCNAKKQYEKYHSVKMGNDIIKLCVDLASKYMTDKNLPDSAIDIIDEVGASISSMVNEPEQIQTLKNELKGIKKEIKQAIKGDNQEKIDELTEKEHRAKLELIEVEKQYQKDIANRPEITEDMVYQVVSEQTDIPLTKLSVDDKKALIGINNILKQSIIGQDEAIDVVSRVIKRNRVGITNGRTMANLFFIGGTGCGKTLLAKKLAQEIFGDEKYLVRFDMSEYSDKSSVSKLIGSSPGLVGYENGGLLTEAIKHKKHCVLLLDEIEKADPDVYNIFLQLFDEGHLTDNTGQRIDFKNVIIIMTSNIGVRNANEFAVGIGFNANTDKNKKDILKKELNKQFPPEFLNRIDDIVYFNELNNDNLKNIIKLELNKLNKRIKEIGYEITYSDETIDYLFNIVKNEKNFGARPVIRTIQDEIENVITDLILENDYLEHTFVADIVDEKLTIN